MQHHKDIWLCLEGAINSICGSGSGCNIVAVSDYDGSNNPFGIGFDFQFTGYNNSPFGLTGFYAGIEGKNGTDSGGLVWEFGSFRQI